ncbi:MAG: PAS domain-containing protein [Anaerolineae bacterium]|nr:PAS domain-containing protein [Anaerolineae bacterium]
MSATLTRLVARFDIPAQATNRTLLLLNRMTLAIITIALVHAGVMTFILKRYDIALYGLASAILSTLLNLLARWGHVRLASYLFIGGLWVVVTLPNLLLGGDGVYGVAFSAYIIPVLLAGFLLGGKTSFWTALFSLLAGIFFALRANNLPNFTITYTSVDVLLKLSSEALFFFVAATLLTLTNRSVAAALNRAQSSEENLLIRNGELEREIADRQQIELALRASDQTAKEFQDYLKELHEVSMQLANVTTLDELHRQAIVFGLKRLGFDRMGWFMLSEDGHTLLGTYGTDLEGNVEDVYDVRTEVALDNWTSSFQRFSSNGHVYFRIDTDLKDRNRVVGLGWNAFAAVTHGDTILGWLVADNLLHHQPLQDYQLELMRLYGAMLGQLFVQKQTQQLLAEKDNRLQLALNAAQMRSWDWDILTDEIVRHDLHETIALPIRSNYAEFISQVYPDDQHIVLNAARQMVERTGIFEAEYRAIDDTGTLHWFYSLGQPYQNDNGEIIGVAGVIQDITGRKSIEESLKRADQQAMELILERERVGALTEFINTISHDFKTPLAIINNSLYLLQRIDDPVKQKDKLNLIKMQTLLLDKQIQDILTISRLEYAPQTVPHSVNINILLGKIGELFHPSFEHKNQTVKFELQSHLPNVLADADELDRAFVNLVENAINYTPVGGSITITTHVMDGEVECAITDTGIGMTAPDTHQIFNNFYRAENARMINSKGTGLGLAIVKRIVTNHNGTITVDSELGKGTSFHLRFPIMVEVE